MYTYIGTVEGSICYAFLSVRVPMGVGTVSILVSPCVYVSYKCHGNLN